MGFLASSGVYKPKEAGKPQPPITIAQIATIHEFGSSDGKIPQRSFMGSSIDENQRSISSFIGKLASAVVAGQVSEVIALGKVGQMIKDLFRKKIISKIPPPLKASTLKKKGAGKSTPLVDTGQLVGSIAFEVRKGTK